MKVIKTIQVLFFASLLGLVSCNTTKNLPMKNFSAGEYSELTQQEFKVISNESELKSAYAKVIGGEIAPTVNWNTQQVVQLAMGQRYSGGFSIKVEEVKQVAKEIQVYYKTRGPKAGDIATQALTAPYVFVTIDNPKKLPVIFIEKD